MLLSSKKWNDIFKQRKIISNNFKIFRKIQPVFYNKHEKPCFMYCVNQENFVYLLIFSYSCLMPLYHSFYCTGLKYGVMIIMVLLNHCIWNFVYIIIMKGKKCTPNCIVYGELGRIPMSVAIKARMICFFGTNFNR